MKVLQRVTDRAGGGPRGGGSNRLIRRGRLRPRVYKLSRKATIFVYGAFHTALPSRSESNKLGASVGLVASEICGLPDSLPSPRLDPLGAATSHPRWPRVPTESWPLSPVVASCACTPARARESAADCPRTTVRSAAVPLLRSGRHTR